MRQRLRDGAARMWSRAFPGPRIVWLAGALTLLVVGVLAGRMLVATTATLTGTNSVGVGTIVAEAASGQTTCVRDLVVPAETGQVGAWIFPQRIRRNAEIRAWLLDKSGRRIALRSGAVKPTPDFHYFDVGRPVEHRLVEASFCFEGRGTTVGLGGASVQRLPESPVSSVAGQPLTGVDVAVRFAYPRGESKRFASALPRAIKRSMVFEPAVGRVLTVLALPALLFLLYFVLRVSATAGARTVKWLAIAACAVTFVHGTAWAVLLHPLHGADESEHFAYAQHLASAGSRPDEAATSQRPPYASAEDRLMGALHHNSTTLNPSSRPRWDEIWSTRFRDSLAGSETSDGGGFTESGTGHGPLYYSFIGLPLRVLDAPSQQPTALLVMRLLNALLASVVAGCAVLVAALLLPRLREAAWAAGVVAGLQPVFGSVAGAVNNDTAVNVAAALMVLTLIASLVRFPSARLGAAAGALAVVLPLSKITGFELIPVAVLAVPVMLVVHGWRPTLSWAGSALAVVGLLFAVWAFAVSPLLGSGRGGLVYRHPAIPVAAGESAPPGPAPPSISDKLTYVVQTFVPKPQLGPEHWRLSGATSLERWPAFRIYIDRGYGLYGWKSTNLSLGQLRGIFVVLAVAWLLSLTALVRRLRDWKLWLAPSLILLATIGSVLLFVSWAYATDQVRTDFGEQGRYLFPALVPLSVLVLGGAVVSHRDGWRRGYLAVATVAPAGIALLAWTSALRGWFT